MELLWIIFITAFAAVFAYYCGGYIDRRASTRQHVEEERERTQYICDLAGYSLGFAEFLCERAWLPTAQLTAAAKDLARYTVEYNGEGFSPEEYGALFEEIERAGARG